MNEVLEMGRNRKVLHQPLEDKAATIKILSAPVLAVNSRYENPGSVSAAPCWIVLTFNVTCSLLTTTG